MVEPPIDNLYLIRYIIREETQESLMKAKAITTNQFDELIYYLTKMGVEHKVEDKCGTMNYMGATYTKEVTLGSNHVTTARYIPALDGFVDPSDDTNGGKYNLFVMDAWETARCLGSMYFNEDEENTEKRMI